MGKTQQINASVTNNGTVVNNPTFIYASSDSNIVTVSNTGLVTAIKQGTCNITVTYTAIDNTVYIKNCAITVIPPQSTPTTPTSTLAITGSQKIHTTSSGTYNLANTVNGVTYTWSLTTITDTSLASNIATITASTNNSVTIKSGTLSSQQFYIKVVGSDSSSAKLLVSSTSGFS